MKRLGIAILVLAFTAVAHADQGVTLYDNTTHYSQIHSPAAYQTNYRLNMPLAPGTTGQVWSIASVAGSVIQTTFTTVSGGGGSTVSPLAVFNGSTLISSPTIAVAADGISLTAYAIGSSSSGFKANPSSVTLQGNVYSIAGIAASTGTLSVSTTSLQSQITTLGTTYASSTSTGILKAQDWNTFNAKADPTILTSSGVWFSNALGLPAVDTTSFTWYDSTQTLTIGSISPNTGGIVSNSGINGLGRLWLHGGYSFSTELNPNYLNFGLMNFAFDGSTNEPYMGSTWSNTEIVPTETASQLFWGGSINQLAFRGNIANDTVFAFGAQNGQTGGSGGGYQFYFGGAGGFKSSIHGADWYFEDTAQSPRPMHYTLGAYGNTANFITYNRGVSFPTRVDAFTVDYLGGLYSLGNSTFTAIVNVSSLTGSGLSLCGDSTHALGYTATTGQFNCQAITGSGGTVTSVTGTPPIASSGGTTPAISLSQLIAQNETFSSSITITAPAGLSLTGPINGSSFTFRSAGYASQITSNTILGSATIYADGLIRGSNLTGSASGTNTGDQTITLTGDVTGSGTGSFATTAAALQANIRTFSSSITITGLGGVTVTSTSTFNGNINISSGVKLSGVTGTNGQVLTSGGAGTVPTWTTIASGGSGGYALQPATVTIQAAQGLSVTTITASAFDSSTSSLSVTGSGGFSVVNSSAGQLGFTEAAESTVLVTRTGVDSLWADSTTHSLRVNYNNASSTYTLATSSITPTVGRLSSWSGTGTLIDAGTNISVSTLTVTGATFASLGGSATNGSYQYCSDCTVATPATCTANLLASCVCAGSGTGAFAKRLNATWYCN